VRASSALSIGGAAIVDSFSPRCGLESLEYEAAKKVAMRRIVSGRNGSAVLLPESRRYYFFSGIPLHGKENATQPGRAPPRIR